MYFFMFPFFFRDLFSNLPFSCKRNGKPVPQFF